MQKKFKIHRVAPLFFLYVISVFVLMLFQATLVLSAENTDKFSEQLRIRLEIPQELPIGINNEKTHADSLLRGYYVENGFTPIWISKSGLNQQALTLIKMIETVDEHGLNRELYHYSAIKHVLDNTIPPSMQASKINVSTLVDLELLLSDSFLTLLSHARNGFVNPETIDPEWIVPRKNGEYHTKLQQAEFGTDISEIINNQFPQQKEYHQLRKALKDYKLIKANGGWNQVDKGELLKRGAGGARVRQLIERLMVTGDLAAIERQDVFDHHVESAVVNFQKRHGLHPDGIIGEDTLLALNKTIDEKISQIVVNLERLRWMPDDFGVKYILVNIADFTLDVFNNHEKSLSMKTVVGRNYRRTPVFSHSMSYVVVNPFWEVPFNIIVQDLLKQIQKDGGYIDNQNFSVLKNWGAAETTIDPKNLNWFEFTEKYFPYRLRQNPGPNNALGKVKFMFPNKFNVYLHDTPAKELFGKQNRNFSSGCIRLEKPLELLYEMLAEDANWPKQKIDDVVSSGRTETILLKKRVPIHIVYKTAWVDSNNAVHFRSDIYERDIKVADILRFTS